MMKLLVLAVVVSMGAVGFAAEPPPGATTCSGCHGPSFMPVNGRASADLSSGMEAFRSGERPSTVMGRLMKGFSPAEIQAIAVWIAEQK